MYDNFLFRAKRTVYKWWCIVYKPVYKLIHNGKWPDEKNPDIKYASSKPAVPTISEPKTEPSDAAVSDVAVSDVSDSALNSEEPSSGVDADVLARANEIMARLNREAAEDEEKKQREIEAAKKQASEQERLAAILKSNERNIDAFIQEGLSKRHQQDDSN